MAEPQITDERFQNSQVLLRALIIYLSRACPTHSVQVLDRHGGGPPERCHMGIGSRRASTGAATAALLLCFGTVGTAAAEEVPA